MIGRWSHREYRTRLAWLDEQWNRPDRTDHYLMQVAAEVRRVLYLLQVFGSKQQPHRVELNDCKLKFVTTQETEPQAPAIPAKQTVKEAARAAKAMVLGSLGIKRKNLKVVKKRGGRD